MARAFALSDSTACVDAVRAPLRRLPALYERWLAVGGEPAVLPLRLMDLLVDATAEWRLSDAEFEALRSEVLGPAAASPPGAVGPPEDRPTQPTAPMDTAPTSPSKQAESQRRDAPDGPTGRSPRSLARSAARAAGRLRESLGGDKY